MTGHALQDEERKFIAREFKDAVNMSASELKRWLASEDSRRVGYKPQGGESVGHQSGERIVALLGKKHAELNDDDYAHMRKVVGYVHRHLAQGPSRHDPTTSDWRYSLMNWGHDPEKENRHADHGRR